LSVILDNTWYTPASELGTVALVGRVAGAVGFATGAGGSGGGSDGVAVGASVASFDESSAGASGSTGAGGSDAVAASASSANLIASSNWGFVQLLSTLIPRARASLANSFFDLYFDIFPPG
jgi:hypothetical protein